MMCGITLHVMLRSEIVMPVSSLSVRAQLTSALVTTVVFVCSCSAVQGAEGQEISTFLAKQVPKPDVCFLGYGPGTTSYLQ